MTTNADRAARARTVLIENPTNFELEIISMLTDLKHLCREDDIDFAKCLRLADFQFTTEISEEA